MRSVSISSTFRRNRVGISIQVNRVYHSFPDPNEQARITSFRSSSSRQVDKSKLSTVLDKKFQTDKVFPGVEKSNLNNSAKKFETEVTTLPNGLRVASEDRHSLMTSLAFIVKTGSSYETKGYTGVTQMLELNAFKSSTARSHHQLSSDIENLGGMVQCISTRENIFYCVDILRENVEQGLDILAETIFQPTFPDEEIEESKSIISWASDELPGNTLSRDAVQIAGYIGSPLSNPHYCPNDFIGKLNAQMLRDFKSQQYFGNNSIIAAAGIEHDTLVKMVESRFSGIPQTSSLYIPRPPSVYTGGMHLNERELKEPFIRICLAFECGGWMDDSLVPLCVLQTLLGGGSSFSAGGPGKGMYTRLYREVLNRCYWAESAESFLSVHEESGLIGIDASCDADHVPQMIQVIVTELTRLSVQLVTNEELSRAKNMLKSLMMMQLESRMVLCEDIGRQIITYGHRQAPELLCAKIDQVTANDLMLVARKMVLTPPSIGIVGPNLTRIPRYEDIKSFTTQYRDELFRKHGVDPTIIAPTALSVKI